MTPTGRGASPPLGRLVVLTDRAQAASAGHELVAVIGRAAAAGADTVVLREKDLLPDERAALAEEVAATLAPAATTLVVASDPDLARRVGGVGVHLAQADPAVGTNGLLVGRSCHGPTEIGAAAAEGVDYLFVSPVAATPSKPGHGPALGPDGAAHLVGAHAPDTPTYGLGGITPELAPSCRRAGLAGVAVMGAVMTAPDPGAATAALKQAVATPSGVGS